MPFFPKTPVCLFPWLLAATALAAPPQAERAIRHSDVVFMYDNPKLYEAYGCTAMGWAGSSDAKHVEAAHAHGVRMFCSSVGFLTEFSGVIDFSPDFLDAACRNFEGKPFTVPWLWDHKHKGQSAWWWCTNSPLYRKYLESRIEKIMKAPLDGLHIDDWRGTAGSITWRSGGFCRHCMAGFREYLAKNVSKEKLAGLGITDPAKFDYRQFLLDRGVKPSEYNSRRASLPLAAEFLDFQVKADTAFIAEYRNRAETLRGKPLALCVNSGLEDPAALSIASHVSYFCCEVGHHAEARTVPLHPIAVYKLADGVNRPVTSTASGQDWAYVAEHKLPGLVRTWIALSYACGHNLMAPHYQWAYTDEKGTHWYHGPTKEFAWMYQFVRRNAPLLDGYEAVAPVAVVYDNAARRRGRGSIEPILTSLASRNIPFTVVVAGDDWLDYRLDTQRLAAFRGVIVAREIEMDAQQRRAIDEVKRSGRLVVWPDDAALAKIVPLPVVVENSSSVLVMPRAIPGNKTVPVVVHLLNRQYDGQKDAMTPQRDFTVRLRRDLFDGRKLAKAVLHEPKAEPQPLQVTADEQHVKIKVPQLNLWGLVELSE